MQMIISPYVGAGDVALGMSKSDVRQALGAPSREFFRGEVSEGLSWQYEGRGLVMSFDTREACDAIELDAPCDPVLQGVHLLSTGAPAAMEALRRLDPGVTLHGDSLVSHRLGVCIYAPEADSHPDWPASGILVFGPDYYGSPDR